MLYTVLVVVLILLVIGALPGTPWPAAHQWGYYPSGIIGLLIIILLILLLTGRL